MQPKTLILIFLAALVAMTPLHAQQPEAVNPSPAVARARATFGRLPLTFEENRGQASGQIKFLSRGKGYTAFLTAGGMVLRLRPSQPAPALPASNLAATSNSQPAANAVLQFKLLGAAQ